MSSRRPSHNASKSSSLQGWSKWEWNETFNCESRTRLKKGRNEYEYEYRNFKERETPQLSEHDDLNPPPGTSAQGASSHSRGSFSSRRDTNHIHGQAQTLDYTANTVSSMQYTSSYSSNQVMSNITSGMAQMDLNHISGTPDSGRYEPFDKRYKIHRGSEFEQFRVFKVLWSEPQGGNTNSVGSHDTRSIRETKNGTQFAKVRRFVIISPMSGHCLCLPINTYLRQGTTKKGVHAEDHTIVYTDNPVYLEGEWEKGDSQTYDPNVRTHHDDVMIPESPHPNMPMFESVERPHQPGSYRQGFTSQLSNTSSSPSIISSVYPLNSSHGGDQHNQYFPNAQIEDSQQVAFDPTPHTESSPRYTFSQRVTGGDQEKSHMYSTNTQGIPRRREEKEKEVQEEEGWEGPGERAVSTQPYHESYDSLATARSDNRTPPYG